MVAVSLGNGTDTGAVSLTSAKGSEVLIHQSTSKGNSYSKMVFADTGVLYDKAKATSATLSTGAGGTDSIFSAADTNIKKITADGGVSAISIKAGDKNNTVIDASLAGAGISLVGGAKNDKFIGSGNADVFIYTAGKDIIQNFDAADSISLGGLETSNAKITAGKKSIKFKFRNKDMLTVKGDELSGTLTIDGTPYTYGKNSMATSA